MEELFPRTGDHYALYQLKCSEEAKEYSFRPLAELRDKGLAVKRENYELVYSGPLTQGGEDWAVLEALFVKFNLFHPEDFRGRSLSVSDVIVLRRNGVVSCHYCDAVGYAELPDFLPEERARQPPGGRKRSEKPKIKER